MARDYKNAKRSGDSGSGAGFALGLALGLAVAAGVHFYHVNLEKKQRLALGEASRADKREQRAPASQKPEPQFDFYESLPKYEVVVPEKDKAVQRNAPGAQIDKPGSYVLQAGSYRNHADADRARASLALQGVESKISKVVIEADTWHRVRIGPIRDLKELETTRRKLREAQIDALVIQVGD